MMRAADILFVNENSMEIRLNSMNFLGIIRDLSEERGFLRREIIMGRILKKEILGVLG